MPGGKIAKVTNGDGYNEYTKSAFEDDGSLISVVNINNLSKPLVIMVKWTADTETIYTFDFTGTTKETE